MRLPPLFRLLPVVLAWVLVTPGSGAATFRRAGSRKPTVVLVHGIWNTGRMFRPMMAVLQREGYRCFAPDLRPNDCRLGVRDLTRKLAAQIDAALGAQEPLALVGFSMGGLVVRDYVENVLPDRRRVRAVFLIASGAEGTLWANLSPNAGQRQMAVDSAFLRGLNRDTAPCRNIPLHSYWTPLDLMIVPAVNSRWPEGQATRVWCPLHPWMVRNRTVIADIAARLRALSGEGRRPR